jgi:hypothetical protein
VELEQEDMACPTCALQEDASAELEHILEHAELPPNLLRPIPGEAHPEALLRHVCLTHVCAHVLVLFDFDCTLTVPNKIRPHAHGTLVKPTRDGVRRPS